MQQQLIPELNSPKQGRPPTPSPIPPANSDLVLRAKRGEARAIATLLSQKFSVRGIEIQSHRKGDRFALLVESRTTPPRIILNKLAQELTLLQPEGIRKVEVYGRATGKRLPEWQETIEIEPDLQPAKRDSEISFQISDWLRQGSDRPTAEHCSSQPTTVATLPQPDIELTQFLRFQFNSSETALLPLEGIKEVLKVPAKAILPVPQMPASVLGVYNCRGTILWLVDLGKQLGFSQSLEMHVYQPQPLWQGNFWQQNSVDLAPCSATQMLTTIVVEVEHKTLGLVVPAVLEIEQHNLRHMQPPTAELFPPHLLPFIQGLLARSSSPVLNLLALIHDPVLQTHRQ